MAAQELIDANAEPAYAEGFGVAGAHLSRRSESEGGTSNTERRSRSALETSASTTPRSPRLNASPARTTKKTKFGSETPLFRVFC